MPMISIGEHVKPTRTSKSCNTIPNNASKTLASPADSTVSQHCTGPVEHEVAVGAAGEEVVAEGVAVATARIAMKKKKRR